MLAVALAQPVEGPSHKPRGGKKLGGLLDWAHDSVDFCSQAELALMRNHCVSTRLDSQSSKSPCGPRRGTEGMLKDKMSSCLMLQQA